jgi:hypothetical protein
MTKINKSGFPRAFIAIALVSTFVCFFWFQKEMIGASQVIAMRRTDRPEHMSALKESGLQDAAKQ